MDVIRTVKEMQATAESLRQAGKTIALVPTMGYLHEAHLELMRVGKRHADKLVISIFVNPTQFGPSEDFNRYPSDPEGDLVKADSVGVDIVFMPPVEEMYPHGFQTTVSVSQLSQHLCGLSRPGHFDGVATVVCKLFNITRPHIAIFGQKDYQQLCIISRMVMDLNMDIQIIGVPTIREPDGLAMSSRNTYLTDEQRPSALSLKKSLDLASEMVSKGEQDTEKIIKSVRKLIMSHPFTDIDYVKICDPITLEDIDNITGEALLAVAVKVGSARLIDNCILTRK